MQSLGTQEADRANTRNRGNGAVSITNTSVTIVDHYSGSSAYCGQSGPSCQGRAVIRLQCDRHNRNNDIMDANPNQCKAMNAMHAIEEEVGESQFAIQTCITRPGIRGSVSGATNTSSTSNISNISHANPSQASESSNSTNGSGNASHLGRGRHRLKRSRSATRAHSKANVCATLAAPATRPVPVSVNEPVLQSQHTQQTQQSQTSDHCESAFDNKAFSSDGDSGPELTRGPCLSTPKHALSLTRDQRQRLFELSCDHSANNCITDPLINNESNLSDNNNCLKSDNKDKSRFMKTNNESDSSLKEQICSSGDTDCHVIRNRSTRSTRSSVVKHIGVFYSDLCDVIKAMRSGTQSNSNNNNNNIASNLNTSTSSQPQETNTANTRTNLSGPVVLHNEHLIGGSTGHPQQQQSTQSPYPVQPQSATTCVHTSPHLPHSTPVSANTTLRSPSQSPMRVESQVPDLPDILNSHLPPPPYSTLPPQAMHLPPMSSVPPLVERGRNTPIRAPPPPPPPPPLPVAGRPPLPSRRILHAPTAVLAHCSRPNYLRPTCAVSETETSASKTCLSCNGLSIRWFILLIAFIGLLCAIIGTILGALRSTGREHLTLALLMIGELSKRSMRSSFI